MQTGFAPLSLVLVTLAAPAGAAELMTASQVGHALGFDRAPEQKLLAGEIVTAEREETNGRQLAVSIGIRLKGNPNALAAAVLDGHTLQANPAILGFGKIEPGAAASGVAGVGYTADEVDEIRKLLQAQAGDEFNLSAEELASLHQATAAYDPQQAGDPAVVQMVNEAYRSILLGRLQAYLAHGVAGIALPAERRGVRPGRGPAGRRRRHSSSNRRRRRCIAAWSISPNISRPRCSRPSSGSRRWRMITRSSASTTVWCSAGRTASSSFPARSMPAIPSMPRYRGRACCRYRMATRSSTPIERPATQVAGFMQGMHHELGRGRMHDALVESFKAIRAQSGGG